MSRGLILTSIVAGVLAASGASAVSMEKAMSEGDYRCPRGNMCRGKGSCHGPGYSCAGNNKCMGKGFVMAKSKQDCAELRAKVQAAASSRAKKSSSTHN